MHANSNDPLHGLTLETIVTALVDKFGFKALSKMIEIRCFYNDPSIKSSLKFCVKRRGLVLKLRNYTLVHLETLPILIALKSVMKLKKIHHLFGQVLKIKTRFLSNLISFIADVTN